MKIKIPHAYQWLVEPLEADPSYVERRMFGSLGVYLNGKLSLVLSATGEQPWNGIMVATSHEHHESLMQQFPALVKHPVLGKWLYVSEDHDAFESTAARVVEALSRGDPRVGVIGKPKRRKKRQGKAKARRR